MIIRKANNEGPDQTAPSTFSWGGGGGGGGVIDRRDFTYNYTALVRKCICRLGQAQWPEPKGYVQNCD